MLQTKYGQFGRREEKINEYLTEEDESTAEGEDYDYKGTKSGLKTKMKPNMYSLRIDSTGFPSNRRLKLNLSYEPYTDGIKHKRASVL